MGDKTYLEQALQVANKIVAQCEGKNKKWEDPDFPCSQTSLYRKKKPSVSVASWKRPNELVSNPKLFVDGVESGDVCQGSLGDCYFLGALAVIATRRDLLLPLFVSARPSLGFYQVRFFKNGSWQIVTIDDRLPVNASNKLVFAHCKDDNEMWVPLIEKAYAKLHGYYEAIESGSISSALMDMTGEAAQSYDFSQGEGADLIKSGKFWSLLETFEKEKYLMGCSCRKGGIESDTGMGILGNHAYSVLQAVQVSSKDRLLRIRNPWGHTEWRGKWSDNSKEWTPALMQKLGHSAEDDGTFFMSYEDFLNQFDNLFVCRLLTDQVGHIYQHLTLDHEWTKQTAGGCSNHPTWRQNDQWALTVTKKTESFICLMQPDQRMIQGKEEYKHSLGFTIFKSDNSRKLVSPEPSKVIKQVAYVPGRHVSTLVDLDVGQYIFVPTTFDPVIMPYWVHIFSYHPVTVDQIPDGPGNASAYVKGKWQGKSSGGCFNHQTWVDNPKYWIKFESKKSSNTNIEISLTQGDGKVCFIGLYIFGNYQDGSPLSTNQVAKSVQCTNKSQLSVELSMPTNGSYVIMPVTFKPGEQNTFDLALYTQEKVSLYELNGPANARMTSAKVPDYHVTKKSMVAGTSVKVLTNTGTGKLDADSVTVLKTNSSKPSPSSPSTNTSPSPFATGTAAGRTTTSPTSTYKSPTSTTTTTSTYKSPTSTTTTTTKTKDVEVPKASYNKPSPSSPSSSSSSKPEATMSKSTSSPSLPKFGGLFGGKKADDAPKTQRDPPPPKPSTTTTTYSRSTTTGSTPVKTKDVDVPKAQYKPRPSAPVASKPTPAPKPKSSPSSGGGGGGGSLISRNHKGDVILNFGGFGGSSSSKPKTVTTYSCGGCGTQLSKSSTVCGNCGVKLKK
eukprot:TRINITY_DN399_c3_g1_i1.p1 TRINITY_DN399_c3_g1~~TRINITY_DN399_c3_g1_i1.p1  ORF type:complete len:893 (-),score=210.58 TRINITY_DN399_c3_g1_i1:267-2945(-)